jgi:hypothetical protein
MVIAISAFRSFLIMLINQFPICNKFRKWGVLCGYVLKVLDVMDFKLFLEKYIIRRWTQQTRSNVVQDVSGRIIIENLKLNTNRRYHVLFRTLLKIAAGLLYKQDEEKNRKPLSTIRLWCCPSSLSFKSRQFDGEFSSMRT